MQFLSVLTHFEILFGLFMVFIAAALAFNGVALHRRIAQEKKAWNYGFEALQREEISAAYQGMTMPARLQLDQD